VVCRRQQLELMARVVEIQPSATGPNDAGHRVHTAFPGFMEDRLVLLVLNRAHSVHAAHVVDAVHGAPPLPADVTFATPTIASRVTSAASSSSVMCSEPAGRSGSTM